VDEDQNMDLTNFMWRLYRLDAERVRLVFYCVPGLERVLCRRLKDRGITARRKAKGTVMVNKPDSVCVALGRLWTLPMTGPARVYADLHRTGKRGQAVPHDIKDRRVAAAARLMELDNERR
jgi:hypothetical protein